VAGRNEDGPRAAGEMLTTPHAGARHDVDIFFLMIFPARNI
jgi:hypothetical protein